MPDESTTTGIAETPKIVGDPPGTLTPKPMRPDVSALSSMAALFQRWAEKCESASKDELTPELMWFLKGAAFAFALDAHRARSLAAPSKAKKPPAGDLGLGQAFGIMVDMLRSMSIAGDQTTTPISGNGTLTDRDAAA